MKLLNVSFRNLVQIFVALGFIFGSLSAQAEDLKEQVKLLNKSKSAKDMGSALKKIFNKPEDQRKINADIKTASKMAKKYKWVWKYELKGKEIAFKVNGKIQFTFKPVNANHGEFLFNGQKFTLNHRLSYEDHKKRMSKILFKEQASLEQFFINKAHAFAAGAISPEDSPVLRKIATGASISAASEVVNDGDKARARQCIRGKLNDDSALDKDTEYGNEDKYRSALLKNKSVNGLSTELNRSHFENTQGYNAVSDRWGSWNQRISAIVGNYSDNKWSDGYIQYENREEYGYSYLPKKCTDKSGNPKKVGFFEVSCRGACFDENSCIEKCTKAKMNTQKGWWGMKRHVAKAHCDFAWTVYQNCLYCNHPWRDHNKPNCKVEAKTPKPAPPTPTSCECIEGRWLSKIKIKAAEGIRRTACTSPKPNTCRPPDCTGCYEPTQEEGEEPEKAYAIPYGCTSTAQFSNDLCAKSDDTHPGPKVCKNKANDGTCLDKEGGGTDHEDRSQQPQQTDETTTQQ